jgi:hypothetical protein
MLILLMLMLAVVESHTLWLVHALAVPLTRCAAQKQKSSAFAEDWGVGYVVRYVDVRSRAAPYSAAFAGTTETSCLLPLVPRNSTVPATMAKIV